MRLCEFSHSLGSAIPCRYEDSYVPIFPGVADQPYTLGTVIVTDAAPAPVTFSCPAERAAGAYEPGGAYSIYTAPVFTDDRAAPVKKQ